MKKTPKHNEALFSTAITCAFYKHTILQVTKISAQISPIQPSSDFTDGISEKATSNLIEGTPNPGLLEFRSALVEPTFCPSKVNPSLVHSTSDTNQDSSTITASALNKANSGLDESNSVFIEKGFHPEYSTSGQIQINFDSNKFASDPGKDSTSSASSARGASSVIPEPTQFEIETTGNTVLDGIVTSAMSLDSSSTAIFIFDEGFNISSPNYPNNYKWNTIREWILKPINPESPIIIRFNDFNTNELHYVTISEKDKKDRRFYGNLASPFNVSGHGYMIVSFQPFIFSSTQRGFQATVYNGEQVFIDDGGIEITTPNYPRNYPAYVLCEWVLEPITPERPTSIEFIDFHIYRWDYVKILEKSSGRELRRVNGRYSNFNSSHHGNLKIQFQSQLPGRGFKANIYNGKLVSCKFQIPVSKNRQEIYSSHHFQSYGCEWILAGPGYMVHLDFSYLYIKDDEDYVTIVSREGSRNISGEQNSRFNVSGRGGLILKFVTNSSKSALGFNASVYAVIPNGTIEITSPNYPGNYPWYSICEWILRPINAESRITIIFNEFHTLKDIDYVTISENDKEDRRFSGNLTTPFNVSGHGYMIVSLQTDPYYSNLQRVFQATVYNGKQVFIDDERIEITTPNYPRNYPAPVLCEWVLEPITPERPTTIEFIDFNIYWRDYVQILEKSSGQELRRVYGYYSNFNSSHHGYLKVQFRSRYEYTRKGFKANIYNGKLVSCKFQIPVSENRQEIYSSQYLQSYGCEWILAGPGYMIHLEFSYLYIKDDEDYVTVLHK